MDEAEESFETVVLPVNGEAPEREVIERAAAELRAGRVVAIPTETVYGLAALALDPRAVARIFEAKGRPPENPLIVHVSDGRHAEEVVAVWPDAARALAERFWPGPLTLVLPRRDVVPDIVTAGLDTVAVRAPAHPVARALIREVGPLAAPSANPSNRISPTTAEHVARNLGGRIPLILDAGPTKVGIESTVLSLVGDTPLLLRPGSVSRDAIAAVVGEVAAPTESPKSGPRPSPGQMARHYSPRAELIVVPEGDRALLQQAVEGHPKAGALVHSFALDAGTRQEKLPDEPVGYARGLYSALHSLDADCDRIVVEAVPDDDAWRAIADRLSRAAR